MQSYFDEHVPESAIETLGHSVNGITYGHYAHRPPLAFKAIMTLPQPSAFTALVRGFDGQSPCADGHSQINRRRGRSDRRALPQPCDLLRRAASRRHEPWCNNLFRRRLAPLIVVAILGLAGWGYAFRLAFLRAYVGKWDAYNELCKEALDGFYVSNDSIILERTAKMCLFSKHSTTDMQRACQVADRASALAIGGISVYAQLTRGIADLRREKYAEALESLNGVAKSGVPSSKDGNDIIVALEAIRKVLLA